MRRVLILNSSYEPLTTVTLKRAVVLILREKAEIIEDSGREVRSATVSVAAPRVIRLLAFVKVPYRAKVPVTRRGVLNRDRNECCYCTRRKATTIDHIRPRSRGGKHMWENVVASCTPCNARKDARTPEEAGMEMRFQPFVPAGKSALVVAIGWMDPAWEPYLVA